MWQLGQIEYSVNKEREELDKICKWQSIFIPSYYIQQINEKANVKCNDDLCFTKWSNKITEGEAL